MSKEIVLVPLEQISRLEIVVTKCCKSLAEVKGRPARTTSSTAECGTLTARPARC